MNALSLLGRLDALDEPLPGADGKSNADNERPDLVPPTRRERVLEYLSRCRNYDGGFGSVVGAESHAAQGAQRDFTPSLHFTDGIRSICLRRSSCNSWSPRPCRRRHACVVAVREAAPQRRLEWAPRETRGCESFRCPRLLHVTDGGEGVLQLLGTLSTRDPRQGAMDRRAEARGVHPLCPG